MSVIGNYRTSMLLYIDTYFCAIPLCFQLRYFSIFWVFYYYVCMCASHCLYTVLQVQSGLGLSELWYSCIVSVISVGQLTGAVSVGLLSKHLPTKYILLGVLCLCCSGGVFYAVGKYGWMLLIGLLAGKLCMCACIRSVVT